MSYPIALASLMWLSLVPGAQPAASIPPAPAVRVIDGVVSLFVIPTGRGTAVLIDCGLDPEGTRVLAALRERGLGPAQVAAIFITHRHADHVGGCDLFPAAKRYAFPDTEGTGPKLSRSPMVNAWRWTGCN